MSEEINVSDGLGTGLLQVRDRMWLPKDKVPDNSVLWPIA